MTKTELSLFWDLLDLVYDHPERTDREIAARIGVNHPGVRRRLTFEALLEEIAALRRALERFEHRHKLRRTADRPSTTV
jgi:hypothetical protein